jgi:hypothetical protein
LGWLCRWLLDAGHECWADDYVPTEACGNLVAWGPEAEGERARRRRE